MAVWCQYKNSAKIIKFIDPLEVPEQIASVFQLNDVEVSLQYFDKDFNEYVDLGDFSAIENKMKIRVLEINEVSKVTVPSDDSLLSNSLVDCSDSDEQSSFFMDRGDKSKSSAADCDDIWYGETFFFFFLLNPEFTRVPVYWKNNNRKLVNVQNYFRLNVETTYAFHVKKENVKISKSLKMIENEFHLCIYAEF